MRIRLSELRELVGQELALETKKKEPREPSANAVEPGETAVLADDSDILLGDMDEEDSFIVPPEVQRSIKHYFTAMGLAGRLPKHARLK